MKYGMRLLKASYEPREYFAERIAFLVENTINESSAAGFHVSLVELDEDGEILAD